jgi:hypothetical protein
MAIFVDGAEVFSEKRPYNLSNAWPVRVHAGESTVDVKSVVVKPFGRE